MLNEQLFMNDYTEALNQKSIAEQEVNQAVSLLVGFDENVLDKVKKVLLEEKVKSIDENIEFYEKYIIKEVV